MNSELVNKILVAVGLIATLTLFNMSIQSKETILEKGELVLLEMAPVDPRAPFQGDFMVIGFKGVQDVSVDSIPKRGFCILKPAGGAVYEPVRFQAAMIPKKSDERAIRYTTSRWSIEIGSSTFFFQEGKAASYDSARYAGYRLDPSTGKSILIGLYDQQRQRIP
jgi:uncharacterized membrane-anchored protein